MQTSGQRKKVYLDQQVWHYIDDKEEIREFFINQKENCGWSYYLSTAHIEELHTARMNETEDKIGLTDSLEKVMRDMAEHGVIKETIAGMRFFSGDTQYDKAKEETYTEDTRLPIKNRADQDLHNQKASRWNPNVLLNQLHMLHSQGNEFRQVWDTDQMQEVISDCDARQNMPVDYDQLDSELKRQGLYDDEYRYNVVMMASMTPVISISRARNQYEEDKGNYLELESTISLLFDCLSLAGFNREKNRNANSSQYDIQHAIRATYCDIFVSNENKFLQKYKAVAYYYGIPIEIIPLKELSIT